MLQANQGSFARSPPTRVLKRPAGGRCRSALAVDDEDGQQDDEPEELEPLDF